MMQCSRSSYGRALLGRYDGGDFGGALDGEETTSSFKDCWELILLDISGTWIIEADAMFALSVDYASTV